MVYFAFELYFNNLAALGKRVWLSQRNVEESGIEAHSIVEVRSDDESFLSAFLTVSDGDNVARLIHMYSVFSATMNGMEIPHSNIFVCIHHKSLLVVPV